MGKFMQSRNVGLATRILAIPTKRTDHKIVLSLSRNEIDAILAVPDLKQWQGKRDHILFSTLYNTGARVSEITNLKREHIQFGDNSFVHILGKGRKERDVPIWKKTAINLKRWLSELDQSISFVFPNARGKQLSRNGVNFLLKKMVEQAKTNCPSLNGKKYHLILCVTMFPS